LAGAEMAMVDCGVKVEPGSGVAAAADFWQHNNPPRGLSGQ
jgi:alanine-glyoxylate transaminase/serine-glyoxylate transaminase/serine-pyruvate transaminase